MRGKSEGCQSLHTWLGMQKRNEKLFSCPWKSSITCICSASKQTELPGASSLYQYPSTHLEGKKAPGIYWELSSSSKNPKRYLFISSFLWMNKLVRGRSSSVTFPRIHGKPGFITQCIRSQSQQYFEEWGEERYSCRTRENEAVAQYCECTECHWIDHFKMVNFMLHEFYSNERQREGREEREREKERKKVQLKLGGLWKGWAGLTNDTGSYWPERQHKVWYGSKQTDKGFWVCFPIACKVCWHYFSAFSVSYIPIIVYLWIMNSCLYKTSWLFVKDLNSIIPEQRNYLIRYL